MKSAIIFICSNCDAQSPKWAGRCSECGSWGTLAESMADDAPKKISKPLSADAIPFSEIKGSTVARIRSGIGEFDQVLGGGIVPGSLILLGGEPGIGKSTLLLQLSIALMKQASQSILYCSGEESAEQVKLRFDRLYQEKNEPSSLFFLSETNCEKICATIEEKKPLLAIVDSIQTIHSREIESEAGSIAQVRACTVKLLEVAKQKNVAIMITGHVTKEGMVAGPKTLEHLVDTVLYLEGDNHRYFRLLKTVKNRFGSTNEIGVFEMGDDGLREVTNPSLAFLSGADGPAIGTATSVVMEGSRAFLVQIQALVTKTYFGVPARRAVGCDANRLQLLIAVLAKRCGLHLGDQDIHVNIVGGIKISEPAADLAICASVISAFKNKPLDAKTFYFGEVGLNGEVRTVSMAEKRIKEAEKLGFEKGYLPQEKKALQSKLELFKIKNVSNLEL